MVKSNFFSRFIKDTRGANMVEYILLVGVVALISIAAFKAFGGKVQDKIKAQGDTVGQINATPGQLQERTGFVRVAARIGRAAHGRDSSSGAGG